MSLNISAQHTLAACSGQSVDTAHVSCSLAVALCHRLGSATADRACEQLAAGSQRSLRDCSVQLWIVLKASLWSLLVTLLTISLGPVAVVFSRPSLALCRFWPGGEVGRPGSGTSEVCRQGGSGGRP